MDFGTSDFKYGPIASGERPEIIENRGYFTDKTSIMQRISGPSREVIVGKDIPLHLEARQDLSTRLVHPMRNGIVEKDDQRSWAVVKELTRFALESAKRNAMHGDRLSRSDKENQARKICERDPATTEQEIADALGVSQQTVSSWVSDIKLRQKAERQAIIYKLNLLGWTQEEIGKAVNLTQQAISDKISDLPELVKLVKTLLDRGEPVEKAAEKLKIDLTLAWAILLDGKDDLERFTLFGLGEYQNIAPRLYNVWYFMRRDPRLGLETPGNIPGQIAMNVLYYFTNQGDLV